MTVTFYPNLPFGQLELLREDGSAEADIPSWLVDRPDVLEALAVLAKKGGTEALGRAPDWHDVIVDVPSATVTYRLEDK